MSKVLVDRELLPCPFCGQQDAFVEQLDSDASVVICQGMVDEHSACLARGPVGVQQSDLEDQPGRDAAIAEWNRRAQPAEAEGADRQRMIESMCLTWRHDFGLDKPADCQLSSGMTDTERHQLRGQIGKLFDHHFAPTLSAVTAERDRLAAALSAPDTIKAEPAGDYDNLRKQFLSLRMLANSNAKMVHHWRAQCDRETREALLANAASVNAERDTNSMLTDALETAERERDQLRAEVDALRKDAERYRWLRGRLPGSAYRIAGVIYSEGGDGVDAAVDAAMAAKEA